MVNVLTWSPKLGKYNACHVNIVLHIPERERTPQGLTHSTNLTHSATVNAYQCKHRTPNTPHIVAVGYLQGKRIPELHRLSWHCLDNTLKLEMGILNPHTCVGTHSTKLTHTVQTRNYTDASCHTIRCTNTAIIQPFRVLQPFAWSMASLGLWVRFWMECGCSWLRTP